MREFERLYASGWRRSSGSGSTISATATLRTEIPRIVAELGVMTVLDAGCGDGLWMPDLPGYIGIDISPTAIDRARARHPDRDYRVGSVTGPLPACDLVICRDVLMHLPLAMAEQALANIRASGARWLMATTYQGGRNRDVPAGGFYRIDMLAPPFAMGESLSLIRNGGRGEHTDWHRDKLLGVWAL